jgi:hypothetical protein
VIDISCNIEWSGLDRSSCTLVSVARSIGQHRWNKILIHLYFPVLHPNTCSVQMRCITYISCFSYYTWPVVYGTAKSSCFYLIQAGFCFLIHADRKFVLQLVYQLKEAVVHEKFMEHEQFLFLARHTASSLRTRWAYWWLTTVLILFLPVFIFRPNIILSRILVMDLRYNAIFELRYVS